MTVFIWLIVGILILTITLWVAKHTYRTRWKGVGWVIDLNDHPPLPVWGLLIIIILSFIPIANAILFFAGALVWFLSYMWDDVRLGCLPKWVRRVQEFLTKEVEL